MSTLVYLKCSSCDKKFDADKPQKLCSCGKVLYPQYDLEKAKETLTKDTQGRKNDIWRMEEIMPCSKNYQFTLGEGWTPLLKLRLCNNVHIKEEGLNPTGSFKSRGLCAAVSRGIELGIKNFVIPTAGNAGAALSAYCARTGTNAHVFVPKDSSEMIKKEIRSFGADLYEIDGLITDAGREAKVMAERHNWFDVSTLKEPYRVEGKKTMGLELAEQFNWSLPDVIIYPTGGGTGIVGMYKAFKELEELGLISERKPRMVSVQSSGCAPIVKAVMDKNKTADDWINPYTKAAGLRVPSAIGDYLILEAIFETNGTAIAVDDNEIIAAMKEIAKKEGIFMSSEAAATYAGFIQLENEGWIDKDENTVLFSTATGFTTPEFW